MRVRPGVAAAHVGGLVGTDLQEVTADVAALDRGGRWAVALPYDGPAVLARFGHWQTGSATDVAGPWRGPDQWTIAAGDVYQANVCRVMRADLPDAARSDIGGLHALLDRGNPAPFSGMLRLPDHGIHVATASPELFLRSVPSTSGGDEGYLESGPIKGTGRTPQDLTEKDCAENVMIVDLVRNDLGRVCRPGSVHVPALLERQHHPGLDHLVSTVEGELRTGISWAQLLEATFAPGSVTGAPKIAALAHIRALEPVERNIYCGAIGWVDADRCLGELNVAIRTFWMQDDTLCFGTGGAITWDSTAEDEWAETELKAHRLIALASSERP